MLSMSFSVSPSCPFALLNAEFSTVLLRAEAVDEAVDAMQLLGDIDLLGAVGDALIATDAECGLTLAWDVAVV